MRFQRMERVAAALDEIDDEAGVSDAAVARPTASSSSANKIRIPKLPVASPGRSSDTKLTATFQAVRGCRPVLVSGL
jgi:hypothetical protein